MADILCIGMTEFPWVRFTDDKLMSNELRNALSRPDLPENLRDPRNWPAEMRAEWGDDQGLTAAVTHREKLVAGFRRVRAAIDAFQPDFVLVWNKDHYENFREYVLPPFCVCAFEEAAGYPYKILGKVYATPNVWGEPVDT